jgi:hypothetical protein
MIKLTGTNTLVIAAKSSLLIYNVDLAELNLTEKRRKKGIRASHIANYNEKFFITITEGNINVQKKIFNLKKN